MKRFIELNRGFSMKKLIILSLKNILRALPVSVYKRADLNRLMSTRVCVKCELSEANLENADLLQVNLDGR